MPYAVSLPLCGALLMSPTLLCNAFLRPLFTNALSGWFSLLSIIKLERFWGVAISLLSAAFHPPLSRFSYLMRFY